MATQSQEAKKVFYLPKKIKVLRPDENETLTVYARPGDKVNFDFDTSEAKFKLIGSDIVVKMPDGGEVIFATMATMAFEDNPPQIILSNGQVLKLDNILMQIDDIKESEINTVVTDEQVELQSQLEKIKAQVEKEKESLKELQEQSKKEQEKQKILGVEFNSLLWCSA